MSLDNLLVLILLTLFIRIAFPGKLRTWALLISSTGFIFWLQPALPVRNMDFWFPASSIGVIFLSWGLVAEQEQLKDKHNWLAGGLMLGTLLLIGLTRFIDLNGLITPSRPPQIHQILLFIAITATLTLFSVHFIKSKKTVIAIGIVLLLIIFIFIKTPFLITLLSKTFRDIMSQNPLLATSTDLRWLGFSYLAFRLIHTLVDRLKGRLDNIKLQEYVIYTLFFPAFIAGPLDRLQHFRQYLKSSEPLKWEDINHNGKRLASGLLRKYILADSLSLIAISGVNVSQVQSIGWMWVMLIAYSFQIYFDFAGYTDIAIGLGGLLGFRLPENFNQPYLKPNLANFWNNWHMTLTQWSRGYYFFPLTRRLRQDGRLPSVTILFITQVSTMLLIGLWHGITLNFLFWGLWHGLGLFAYNRWSSLASTRMTAIKNNRPILAWVFNLNGILFTFLFVSLGWVWFALPSPSLALNTFSKLFGIAM